MTIHESYKVTEIGNFVSRKRLNPGILCEYNNIGIYHLILLNAHQVA